MLAKSEFGLEHGSSGKELLDSAEQQRPEKVGSPPVKAGLPLENGGLHIASSSGAQGAKTCKLAMTAAEMQMTMLTGCPGGRYLRCMEPSW